MSAQRNPPAGVFLNCSRAGDCACLRHLPTRPLLALLLSCVCLSLCAQAAKPLADVASATAPTAGNLFQYEGQYRDTANPDQVHTIYVEDGVLYVESEGRERQRLTPDVPDRFRIASPPAHVLFLRDASGAVSGLRVVLDSGGRALAEAARISATPVRPARFRAYTRQEAMIPMRDGVRLHVAILRPAHVEPGEALPFLLDRTPYGVDGMDAQSVNQSKPELAASGYLFVFEDVRGRYKSEGQFVMNRPLVSQVDKDAPPAAPSAIDETTDAWDTIDWLVKDVPGNNGRAGVYGVSYDGFLAMMAGIDAHPAVKAISPQAPMTDVWMGDDFFHNGAFRQTYGFDYVQQMEAQKTDARVDSRQDTYSFFLSHVNFAAAAAATKMSDLPTAQAFLTQPAYSNFWRDMAVEDDLARVHVPTLEVGGYWDQEDMWGTQAEYAALKQHDPVFLVLGPWNHGGWEDTGRTLSSNYGGLDLGQPTGTDFRRTMEEPFFEKYLKDRSGFDLADTASFRTGVNQWERYDTWPPAAGFTPVRLYLEPDKKLSFDAPVANAANTDAQASSGNSGIAASYVSDPADPVPYRHRPIQSTYARGSQWYTWLVEDQRFVTARKDVATFTLPALDHDLTIAGDVTADLFASTTGSDADWVVKLIDVYPPASPDLAAPGSDAGYQLMVADEIFRGRYLHSFQQPQPLKPGEVDEFKWSLHGVDHTFLKGHSIMVEVQSTWFPLYDRNPQTFVPNIMAAPASTYRSETMTLYGSAQYPSHLDLSIAK